MHELETVQQCARARGMRVRIEGDQCFEMQTYTLLGPNDLPTKLRDVPLQDISAELARSRTWLEPEPGWKALVPKPEPPRAPQAITAHWVALECEALRRFDAG